MRQSGKQSPSCERLMETLASGTVLSSTTGKTATREKVDVPGKIVLGKGMCENLPLQRGWMEYFSIEWIVEMCDSLITRQHI